MPAIDALNLHVNPSLDPLSYPGNTVVSDSLLVEGWLYELSSVPGCSLSQWVVESDGGPIRSSQPLDSALATLGAPTMPERVASLAIGSNASPGQLRHKFGVDGPDSVVPISMGIFRGVQAGYSAHVSRAGYIPYAPTFGQGTSTYCILWLSESQMRRLDATEPNYISSELSGSVRLTNGLTVSPVTAYRGRWGVLRGVDGLPLSAGTQAEIFLRLLETSWFRSILGARVFTAEEVVARLCADGALRERVRDQMRAHGCVIDDGLAWGVTTQGQA